MPEPPRSRHRRDSSPGAATFAMGIYRENSPPVFCPGCSHGHVLRSLEQALASMGFPGGDVVVVSDIGCSGLIDTFLKTHAFHGLHGRALTYATGIKMARPNLKVIITMGDGGPGIGGALLMRSIPGVQKNPCSP